MKILESMGVFIKTQSPMSNYSSPKKPVKKGVKLVGKNTTKPDAKIEH